MVESRWSSHAAHAASIRDRLVPGLPGQRLRGHAVAGRRLDWYTQASVKTSEPLELENRMLHTGRKETQLRETQADAHSWRLTDILDNECYLEDRITSLIEAQWRGNFHLARQPWAQCNQGGIGTFLGRIGGIPGDFERGLGVRRLLISSPLGVERQAIGGNPHERGKDRQHEGEGGEGNGAPSQPPIECRLLVMLVCFVGSVAFVLRGRDALYEQRRARGPALFGCAALYGLAGF